LISTTIPSHSFHNVRDLQLGYEPSHTSLLYYSAVKNICKG
jgi:hypothetical protein